MKVRIWAYLSIIILNLSSVAGRCSAGNTDCEGKPAVLCRAPAAGSHDTAAEEGEGGKGDKRIGASGLC